MAQVMQKDEVVSDGQSQSGVSKTTQTVADPVTGSTSQHTSTHMWSGKNPGVQLVWLVTGVAMVFLALDFIFHASGANNVGFAAFVFSVGTFLASPFAGIFNTTYATAGNLVIWADILAVAIYALLATLIVRIIDMTMSGRHAAGGV